ncbi:hypothetical protein B5E56_00935 [Flavonifractor sp. An112]|nr:hypothetical protein B5E56_00935 [Flavonifractor sp. An112]
MNGFPISQCIIGRWDHIRFLLGMAAAFFDLFLPGLGTVRRVQQSINCLFGSVSHFFHSVHPRLDTLFSRLGVGCCGTAIVPLTLHQPTAEFGGHLPQGAICFPVFTGTLDFIIRTALF